MTSKEALGEALFSDVNLSVNRTQACSTCHNPDRAFIDDRLDAFGEIGAVSLGDDGISLGDRNTPSAAYAAFSPEFYEGTRDRLNSDAGQYQGF
ncbi:MAG: methylamine utilization protein MauG, partial [Candidatus Thiodiazotropha endolucinida]|nr:methylamine utilization protein MauG [Candidatus Thiodiazotropha taylori]MCW4242749.1 methylamine utilization protein MauG [Candidatus Thiodiazotropha taylori]